MKPQARLDTMRRCPLLIGLLFYIDHVTCLEATRAHNRSSIFHNRPWKNWVVLAAGSESWKNYRHQADVLHAYHVVRANKVPAANIITFVYDDIANNPKNPFPGKVFHDYDHKDVYEGVVIDYREKDVTAENFLKVLKGDRALEKEGKKVLKSGRDDYVFIFFSGHGQVPFIAFPGAKLYARELNDTLAYMQSKKMYKQLVLYIEACYSGSMFQDVLPSTTNTFVTTSSNEKEEDWCAFCNDKQIDTCLANQYSYAWITDSEHVSCSDVADKLASCGLLVHDLYFLLSKPPKTSAFVTTSSNEKEEDWCAFCNDKQIDTCLANQYSYAWITDSEHNDIRRRTLDQQYEAVRRGTTKSHVMKYGDLAMGSLQFGRFQGHFKIRIHPNEGAIAPNVADRKPSSRARLLSMSRRLTEATTEEANQKGLRKLHRALRLGHIVKETFLDIVTDVTTHHQPTVKGLSKKGGLICFEAVFDRFQTHCFTIQQLGAVKLSSVEFTSVQLNSVHFGSVDFNSFQLISIQFSSVQFSSVQFSSGQFSSVQFSSAQLSSGHYSCSAGRTGPLVLPSINDSPAGAHRPLESNDTDSSSGWFVPEVGQQTTHLMELCKFGYEAEILIQSVYNVCS
ncbi:hypothetical protein T265_09853 [Opisthorchis viverrini]|uniref:Peptidase C13 family protein n=1 Tax=Opisthorchis viverrini TaxID=6198 RepID=A0A074ZFC1_OPIVI|nr:hypothetical protein T265_09853 [Opisthorchis viverrini]KER21935.1 hypothetical protein T265_09853 [Opisthorchis viverrini]